LASLPEGLAQQDVVDSWDYLSDRVDIPAVVELSRAIRAAALANYAGDEVGFAVYALREKVEGRVNGGNSD